MTQIKTYCPLNKTHGLPSLESWLSQESPPPHPPGQLVEHFWSFNLKPIPPPRKVCSAWLRGEKKVFYLISNLFQIKSLENN